MTGAAKSCALCQAGCLLWSWVQQCTPCRWSGLIRGAVSVALVYYHFDPRGESEDSKRATLITTTLLVVLFSILVCGALTKPLLLLLLEPQGAPLGCWLS